jgi:hypothetical protein
MSKVLAHIHLPLRSGKSSIVVSEYNRFKLLGDSLYIFTPRKNYLSNLEDISRNLGIVLYDSDVSVWDVDKIRGRRFDRIIIDDLDELLMVKSGDELNYFFDTLFCITDKLMITSTYTNTLPIEDYCKNRGIQYNLYTQNELKGYKIGI